MRKVVRGRVNRGAWVAVLLLVMGGVLGAPALASSPGADPSPAASVVAAPAAGAAVEAAPPTLTAVLSDDAVVFGDAVTVTGALEPAAEGQAVVIRLDGVEVASAVTDAAGAYRASFRPQRGGALVAELPGSDPAVVSPAAALAVKPKAGVSHGQLVPFLASQFVLKVTPASYSGVVTLRVVHRKATVGTYKARVRDGKAVFRAPLRGVDGFTLTFSLPAADGLARRTVQAKVTLPARTLKAGARGPYVKGMLTGLKRLKFYVPGLGVGFTSPVGDVVMAFRKAYRMPRSYVFDAACWRKLDRAKRIRVRFSSPATHIEIDKTRQILTIVKAGKPWGIICVSTGATGNTPEGRFRIQQKHPYTSTPYGGTMIRTMGFLGNYAMHGWPDVPPYPASHGCVREPIWACYWVYDNSWVGETVYVYR
jgi:hypothetical protein